MIVRRSFCAISKLELIDLIDTELRPDLFDRNIGFQVLLGKFQMCKHRSIGQYVAGHVYNVFEGQKGQTVEARRFKRYKYVMCYVCILYNEMWGTCSQ